MNYKKHLEKLFLELASPQAPEAQPNIGIGNSSRTHQVPGNAISPMLDQGTDPDSFLTQGIRDTFDQVRSHFNSKMAEFANDLKSESIDSSTVSDLKNKIKKIYDFTNKVQVFSKAKIDAMAQDPYAIMAGFIASEPTQLAAFAELHKTLEEFSKMFEEIDAKLAGVSSKIEDFIKDSQKIKEPSIMQQNAAQPSPSPSAPSGPGAPTPQPRGGGRLPGIGGTNHRSVFRLNAGAYFCR